jgi:hypothetical protein
MDVEDSTKFNVTKLNKHNKHKYMMLFIMCFRWTTSMPVDEENKKNVFSDQSATEALRN